MRHHAIALALLSLPSLLMSAIPVLANTPGLNSDQVHVVEPRKNKAYIKDGVFIGGDRAIDDVVVKDIRRAANLGFDRMVIDLEGNKNGEPAAISRPPYYQISVSPEEKRLTFTVWGRPKLHFNAKKVLAAFKKSPIIQKIELLPRLEDNSWTFTVNLKSGTPVEVFELSDPIRIIVDIRTLVPPAAPHVNHAKASFEEPATVPHLSDSDKIDLEKSDTEKSENE